MFRCQSGLTVGRLTSDMNSSRRVIQLRYAKGVNGGNQSLIYTNLALL